MSRLNLLDLPSEVLELVALELVALDPVGPPCLGALQRTCTKLHKIVNPRNLSLCARIFKMTFDTSAAVRRFGRQILHSRNLAWQLQQNWTALRRARSGVPLDESTLLDTLWTAYFLLSEDDGKNYRQLEWAGIPQLVDGLVRQRLRDEAAAGWPAESAVNALAVWCMWMTTDREKLQNEPPSERQAVFDLLRPYVLLSCRYPSFFIPDNHYYVPIDPDDHVNFPHSLQTGHGLWPLYRDSRLVENRPKHFNQSLLLAPPLISTAARLLFFARREVTPISIPPNLPATRAHLIALGRGDEIIPTQEDIMEVNSNTHVALPLRASSNWAQDASDDQWALEWRGLMDAHISAPSARWDQDVLRQLHGYDAWVQTFPRGPVYKNGSLSGKWAGRMLIPNEPDYMHLVAMSSMPAEFGDFWPYATTAPVYMNLSEFHCVSPQRRCVIGGVDDGFDDGVRNAWFPEGTTFHESSRGVEVRTQGDEFKYERYVPGQANSHNPDTCKLCTQAETPAAEQTVEEDGEAMDVDEDTESELEAPGDYPRPTSRLPKYRAPGVSPHETWEAGRVQYDGYSDCFEDELEPPERTCEGVDDVIFLGDTEMRHGQAWHFYKYYGRIRKYDGLISLVRQPRDRRQGRFIIRGYLVSDQTFVGTWRVWTEDASQIPWEGPFIMSRRA